MKKTSDENQADPSSINRRGFLAQVGKVASGWRSVRLRLGF
jgi:hypothetical protein